MRQLIIFFLLISLLLQPLISWAAFDPAINQQLEQSFNSPYIKASVSMQGRFPILQLDPLPEKCKLASEATLNYALSVDGASKSTGQFFLGEITSGRSLPLDKSFFPTGYRVGQIKFQLTSPLTPEECVAPPTITFAPEIPSDVGQLLTPFNNFDMSSGGGIGDALKGFVFSTVINTLTGFLTGEVPVGDKSVTQAIGKELENNFKLGLQEIKQQLISTLKDASAHIGRQVLNMVMGRLVRDLSKLQIRDPQTYSILNNLAGAFQGIMAFQKKGCIDPATLACYQASVQNIVTNAQGNRANGKTQRSAALGLSSILKLSRARVCPESKIDSIVGLKTDGSYDNRSPLAFRTLFEKVPFYGQVALQAQTRNIVSNRNTGANSQSSGNLGPFVQAGLSNIIQNQMCQDLASGLQGVVAEVMTETNRLASGEIDKGFQATKKCQDFFGLKLNCVVTNPAEINAGLGLKVAGTDIDYALQQSNNPAVNVLTSWFRNWVFSKVNLIITKGFAESNQAPSISDTSLSTLGNTENIEAACRQAQAAGGAGEGQYFFQNCVEARKAEVLMGAQFDATQAQDLKNRYRQAVVATQNIQQQLTGLAPLHETITGHLDRHGERLPQDLINQYEEVTTRFADLRYQRLPALILRLKSITTDTQLDVVLADIENLRGDNTPQAQEITALQQQRDTLRQEITSQQQEIQRIVSGLNQNLLATQFSGIFYQPVTISLDLSAEYPRQYIDFSFFPRFNGAFIDTFLATDLTQRYSDDCSNHAQGIGCRQRISGLARFQNDLVFFLNQDFAPGTGSLSGSGFVQAAINYLNAIFSGDEIPGPAAMTEIRRVADFFTKKELVYRNLINQLAVNGWGHETITFYLSGQAQRPLDHEALLINMSKTMGQFSTAFQTLANNDLLNRLRTINQIEAQLRQRQAGRQGLLEASYGRLLEALPSTDLDLSAADTNLNVILSEIDTAQAETTFFQSELAALAAEVREVIEQLPAQPSPPSEEPTSQRQPGPSLTQRAGQIISGFTRVTANIWESIFSFFSPRRVRLK